jgi:hypothetical protein
MVELYRSSPEVVAARIALRDARRRRERAPVDEETAARAAVDEALDVLAEAAGTMRYAAWLAALSDLDKTDEQIAAS